MSLQPEPQQIQRKMPTPNPKKLYCHDALTNAYIQCVEYNIPVCTGPILLLPCKNGRKGDTLFCPHCQNEE